MPTINWTELRTSLIGNAARTGTLPSIRLPAMPRAVTDFCRKAEDPKSEPADLAKIIEADSGLTAELLKAANSSQSGSRSRYATARQAISRIGIRNSKLLLMAAAAHGIMRASQSKLLNMSIFCHKSLERAVFARHVAKHLKCDGDLAFAGALLVDMVLPTLANERLSEYTEFSNAGEAKQWRLTDFERQHFGWDHAIAAAYVMLGWGLPDELICCVLLHHVGPRLLDDPELGRSEAAAVLASAWIPDFPLQEPNGFDWLQSLESRWPGWDLMATAEATDACLKELGMPERQVHGLLKICQKRLIPADAVEQSGEPRLSPHAVG
ncbi:MAG: HDOD domain-containing protein [Planctomycetaceae bacterium]|nr:HDOD domain-containing protein [Planctomycetaceae bacterium]